MIEPIAAGGVLLLLDQWSKRVVRLSARNRAITCGPLLTIRYVAKVNEGYAHDGVRLALLLTWCGALMSAIVLYHAGGWFQSPRALVGLGLAFGGATGNLLDILKRRSVVDFIDLGWWPVFNLADVAIVAGLAAALWT